MVNDENQNNLKPLIFNVIRIGFKPMTYCLEGSGPNFQKMQFVEQ
jgi:hypothetical protein